MPTRALVLCLSLLATGCFGPDLSGTWEGEMECDGTTMDLEMDLEKTGAGLFEGDLTFHFEDSFEDTGSVYELEFDIAYEVELTTEGGGAQELDGDAEYDGADCQLRQDGTTIADSCEDLGLDDSDLEDAGSFDGLEWDGEDTIEIDDGDCEGELER